MAATGFTRQSLCFGRRLHFLGVSIDGSDASTNFLHQLDRHVVPHPRCLDGDGTEDVCSSQAGIFHNLLGIIT